MSGIVNSTGAVSGIIGTTVGTPAGGVTTAVGNVTAASSLNGVGVDEDLSFTPTSVIFHFSTAVNSDSIGIGFCGPSNENQSSYIKTLTAAPSVFALENGTYAILSQSGGGSSNRATCTLGTDKFTLTWTKVGSPEAGNVYIKYMAMK